MCSSSAEMIPERLTRQDRANAHDLRNLFGIVACAARLLDEAPDHKAQASILLALKHTALRGGALCDAMIIKASNPLTFPLVDELDGAITAAIPLVLPLLADGTTLSSDLKAARVALPLTGEDIETILVELVGNAVRHGEGASRIFVRSRWAAGRVWLIVADNGRGRLDQLRDLYHGHGLLRIDLLVRRAGGDLQLRRAKGGGLVAGISFPISVEPRLGPRETSQPPAKKNKLENRQPIAA